MEIKYHNEIKFHYALILTWCQFRCEPLGNFFHRLTRSTHALQMSPVRHSLSLKHA